MMIQKLFHTLYINAEKYFIYYFLPAFIIVLLLYSLYLIAKYKKNKQNYSLKLIKDEFLKKHNIISFFFLVYLLVNITSTVLARFKDPKMDPLSNIWGGWTIIESEYFFDFSVIWNILMFLPLCTFLYLFFKYVRGKKISKAKLLIFSTVFSFVNSLLIEVLQIVFKVGTFQFSDLFYNTLGGALGIFVFIIIQKLWNKYLNNQFTKVINKIKGKVGLNQ